MVSIRYFLPSPSLHDPERKGVRKGQFFISFKKKKVANAESKNQKRNPLMLYHKMRYFHFSLLAAAWPIFLFPYCDV
jgi:hypothetical protein